MRASHQSLGTTDGTTFFCFVRREPSFAFDWHYHEEYELTLIVSGTGRRHVGTTLESYRPGDLVLLGPNLPHSYASDATTLPSEAVVTQFRGDFLGSGFFSLPQFRRLTRLLERSRVGVRFADVGDAARASIRLLPRLDRAARTIELLRALDALSRDDSGVPLTGPGFAATPSPETRERIDVVCRHLQQTHTRPVNQADVAALVHMSPTSFSHFFRRTTGTTLTEYVTRLRVEAACSLLLDTSLPVTQIAAQSGFRNMSNFNRRFRAAKGITPTAFRRSYDAVG